MAITVRQTTPNVVAIRSSQGSQAAASVVVKKATDLTIESIKNINTAGIQDGYALLYDEDTNQYVFSSLEASIGNLDGGVY